MKYAVVFVVLLFSGSVHGQVKNDTIPYWHIGYGKRVIIQASLNAVPKEKYQLAVKPDLLDDLTVSFVYGSGNAGKSSLTVKEGNQVLRTFDQHPVMGPVFLVPVRELVGTHQSDVQYELDFYYTDDRGQKNLKLGTIVFIMK